MYKILIVDDEPIAAQSVEFILKKNIKDVVITGISRSGKDAIEKSYESHPDIIIMDINMPGINGLEAMKQIRKGSKDVHFIIVSAFDYFDYAAQAVSIGVEEYLLKPVKDAKLVETVQRVIETIDMDRKRMKKALEQEERFEMVTPILENGFINSICMFEENAEELQNYCNLFDYRMTGGYVMAIEFGQKSEGEITNKIGAGVQGQKMYDDYRNIIKSSCSCIVGPIMLNRIIIYVLEEERKESYEQKSDAVRLAQMVHKRAGRIYPDIYIGIGSYHDRISEAKKSYYEAIQSIQVLTSSMEECQILHIDDLMEETLNNDYNFGNQMEKDIYLGAERGDLPAVILAFDNMFVCMSEDSSLDFNAVRNKMVDLIVGFGNRWGNAIGNYGRVLVRILETNNRTELHNICSKYIGEAVVQIVSEKRKKIYNTIEKANTYIEMHFREEISLEDIAKEVNLSSYYFSRFYRGETGVTFTDKVMNIRIDKAKEYLLKTELSIREVALEVGYSDPNYFSKLFKKLTGFTASEYKKTICP